LVEPNDQQVVILENIPTGRRRIGTGKDVEGQTELFEQFVFPLIDQTAGSDDENPACIGPHNQFTDVKSRHDRLASPRIVRQDIPQWLAGKHRLVNGGDLVWQRIDV